MRLDVRSQIKCVFPLLLLHLIFIFSVPDTLGCSLCPQSILTKSRTPDGAIIAMYYKGVVALTPGVKAVLGGGGDAKTTDFGDSFVTFSFETGSEKWKGLQDGIWVAAGRFVVENGKTIVEYRVSKVGA